MYLAKFSAGELQLSKRQFCDLKPASKSRDVCLVTKSWHDQLMAFVTATAYAPKPTGIDNTSLITPETGDLREDLIFGKDFEIIEECIWKRMLLTFPGPGPCIKRRFSMNLINMEPCVLMFPVQLQMMTKCGLKGKTCNRDWKLADMKRSLCNALGLSDAHHLFVHVDGKHVVNDSWTVGDYVAVHGPRIKLEYKSRARTMFKALEVAPLRATLPHATFTEPQTCEVPQGIRSASCIAKPSPKPVGIANLGNTCFFNAAMQCLVRIKPIVEFIFSPDFDVSINTTNPRGSKGEIAIAFRDFVQEMSSRSMGVKDLRRFRGALIKRFTGFANYGQHDAQEVISAILDGLHEDLNQSDVARGMPCSPGLNAMDMYKARNQSKITELFHGLLRSSVRCPSCGFMENVKEPFALLSLPVPTVGRFGHVNVNACFEVFEKEEPLDTNNMWECPGCGQKVRASKGMKIEKLGPVLILHFKRFAGSGFFASKISNEIVFPDDFQSSRICVEDCGRYVLTGVILHNGGMTGGHYTATVLDLPSQTWYNFNDSVATVTDRKSAHHANAYILVYQSESICK